MFLFRSEIHLIDRDERTRCLTIVYISTDQPSVSVKIASLCVLLMFFKRYSFLFKKHKIIYRCSKDFVEITIHSRNTTYSCGNLDTKICISLKSRPNLWVDNLILFMFAVLRATRHNRNRPRKTKKSTFLKICLENLTFELLRVFCYIKGKSIIQTGNIFYECQNNTPVLPK